MAYLDQLARLPFVGRFVQAIGMAASNGRPDVVRQHLRDFDLIDFGAAHGTGMGNRDQPYEPDEALLGDRLPWAVRRMFTTDAKVQMAVRATVTTASTAEWEWNPGRDTRLARELAHRSNQDFGWAGLSPRMERSWDEIVEEMMLVGPAGGFNYHEGAYGLRRIDGAHRWIVRDYLYRPPEAHQGFEYDGDRFIGVRQHPVGGVGERFIPAHRLLLMGYGAGADNLWGTGWARAAYPWFVLKQHFQELLSLNGEREALGGLMVEVNPKEAEDNGYSAAQMARMVIAAKRAAAQYSQGLITWLMAGAGIKFSQLPGRFNPVGAIAIITQCNQEILAACLGAQLLELGVVSPGNRAIGEIFSTVLTDNVANVLDQFGRRLGGQLGPGRGTATRVHDVNAGRALDPADYPTAVHSGLRPSKIAQILGQLPALRSAGFVTPTDKLEAAIRGAVGEAMEDSARRTVSERLEGANNAVVTVGPAGTPDGMPASPEAVAAGIERMNGQAAGAEAQLAEPDAEPVEPEVIEPEVARPPTRDLSAYTLRNRDVAEMLQISPGFLNTLVRRGDGLEVERPFSGAGRYRLWNPSQLADWWDQVGTPEARVAP